MLGSTKIRRIPECSRARHRALVPGARARAGRPRPHIAGLLGIRHILQARRPALASLGSIAFVPGMIGVTDLCINRRSRLAITSSPRHSVRRSALLDPTEIDPALPSVSRGIIRRLRSRIWGRTGEQVDEPLRTSGNSRQHPMRYEPSGSNGKQGSRYHRGRPPARNCHDRSNNYYRADAYANRQREPIARVTQLRSSSPAQTRKRQTSRSE
jgi:hypothetical protein